MFGRKDKLSREETERCIERIRTRYDHLITSYMAPISLKNDFEARYSYALQMRMSLELFLQGEVEMVEELIQQEEDERDRAEQEALNERENGGGNKKSFADKIVEDLEKRISHYPVRRVHPDAANELVRLYGALQQFERDFWGAVENFLLKIFPSERNGLLAQLDQELWNMTYARNRERDNRDVPLALERYVMMLETDNYHYNLLGETQNCIKRAAFWFHDVRDSIRKARELGFQEERVVLAEEELTRMIEDFRLRDIKKN
ncbi:MAG: hypothetical protein JXA95_01475 [Spirochaetales bacterium]|nr:hypothetical protein [Spirochaetales bacterium]